jgi:hypothetical protein
MPEIDQISRVILAARRKRFLFSRPVFNRFSSVSEAELFHLATRLDFKFIVDLSRWLLLAGYGEIDGELFFQESKFSIIDWEPLEGFVTFADGVSDRQFAFNPSNGSIYSVYPSNHAFVRIADNFPAFLQELIRHDYKLKGWMDTLQYSKQHEA